MLLSVIIPEAPLGTTRMLERELDGIDSEVIVKDWKNGLALATGEFICFLEEDSALQAGTLKANLEVFTSNPLFRKLAMVTSPVDFPDEQNIVYSFTEDAQKRFEISSRAVHHIRVGNVPGAILRRSSVLKINPKLKVNPQDLTMNMCLDFWEAGQRILLNPDTLYFSPEVEASIQAKFKKRVLSPLVLTEWQRECVS